MAFRLYEPETDNKKVDNNENTDTALQQDNNGDIPQGDEENTPVVDISHYQKDENSNDVKPTDDTSKKDDNADAFFNNKKKEPIEKGDKPVEAQKTQQNNDNQETTDNTPIEKQDSSNSTKTVPENTDNKEDNDIKVINDASVDAQTSLIKDKVDKQNQQEQDKKDTYKEKLDKYYAERNITFTNDNDKYNPLIAGALLGSQVLTEIPKKQFEDFINNDKININDFVNKIESLKEGNKISDEEYATIQKNMQDILTGLNITFKNDNDFITPEEYVSDINKALHKITLVETYDNTKEENKPSGNTGVPYSVPIENPNNTQNNLTPIEHNIWNVDMTSNISVSDVTGPDFGFSEYGIDGKSYGQQYLSPIDALKNVVYSNGRYVKVDKHTWESLKDQGYMFTVSPEINNLSNTEQFHNVIHIQSVKNRLGTGEMRLNSRELTGGFFMQNLGKERMTWGERVLTLPQAFLQVPMHLADSFLSHIEAMTSIIGDSDEGYWNSMRNTLADYGTVLPTKSMMESKWSTDSLVSGVTGLIAVSLFGHAIGSIAKLATNSMMEVDALTTQRNMAHIMAWTWALDMSGGAYDEGRNAGMTSSEAGAFSLANLIAMKYASNMTSWMVMSPEMAEAKKGIKEFIASQQKNIIRGIKESGIEGADKVFVKSSEKMVDNMPKILKAIYKPITKIANSSSKTINGIMNSVAFTAVLKVNEESVKAIFNTIHNWTGKDPLELGGIADVLNGKKDLGDYLKEEGKDFLQSAATFAISGAVEGLAQDVFGKKINKNKIDSYAKIYTFGYEKFYYDGLNKAFKKSGIAKKVSFDVKDNKLVPALNEQESIANKTKQMMLAGYNTTKKYMHDAGIQPGMLKVADDVNKYNIDMINNFSDGIKDLFSFYHKYNITGQIHKDLIVEFLKEVGAKSVTKYKWFKKDGGNITIDLDNIDDYMVDEILGHNDDTNKFSNIIIDKLLEQYNNNRLEKDHTAVKITKEDFRQAFKGLINTRNISRGNSFIDEYILSLIKDDKIFGDDEHRDELFKDAKFKNIILKYFNEMNKFMIEHTNNVDNNNKDVNDFREKLIDRVLKNKSGDKENIKEKLLKDLKDNNYIKDINIDDLLTIAIPNVLEKHVKDSLLRYIEDYIFDKSTNKSMLARMISMNRLMKKYGSKEGILGKLSKGFNDSLHTLLLYDSWFKFKDEKERIAEKYGKDLVDAIRNEDINKVSELLIKYRNMPYGEKSMSSREEEIINTTRNDFFRNVGVEDVDEYTLRDTLYTLKEVYGLDNVFNDLEKEFLVAENNEIKIKNEDSNYLEYLLDNDKLFNKFYEKDGEWMKEKKSKVITLEDLIDKIYSLKDEGFYFSYDGLIKNFGGEIDTSDIDIIGDEEALVNNGIDKRYIDLYNTILKRNVYADSDLIRNPIISVFTHMINADINTGNVTFSNISMKESIKNLLTIAKESVFTDENGKEFIKLPDEQGVIESMKSLGYYNSFLISLISKYRNVNDLSRTLQKIKEGKFLKEMQYNNTLFGVFYEWLKKRWTPKGFYYKEYKEFITPGDGNILNFYKRNVIDSDRINFLYKKKNRTQEEENELNNFIAANNSLIFNKENYDSIIDTIKKRFSDKVEGLNSFIAELKELSEKDLINNSIDNIKDIFHYISLALGDNKALAQIYNFIDSQDMIGLGSVIMSDAVYKYLLEKNGQNKEKLTISHNATQYNVNRHIAKILSDNNFITILNQNLVQRNSNDEKDILLDGFLNASDKISYLTSSDDNFKNAVYIRDIITALGNRIRLSEDERDDVAKKIFNTFNKMYVNGEKDYLLELMFYAYEGVDINDEWENYYNKNKILSEQYVPLPDQEINIILMSLFDNMSPERYEKYKEFFPKKDKEGNDNSTKVFILDSSFGAGKTSIMSNNFLRLTDDGESASIITSPVSNKVIDFVDTLTSLKNESKLIPVKDYSIDNIIDAIKNNKEEKVKRVIVDEAHILKYSELKALTEAINKYNKEHDTDIKLFLLGDSKQFSNSYVQGERNPFYKLNYDGINGKYIDHSIRIKTSIQLENLSKIIKILTYDKHTRKEIVNLNTYYSTTSDKYNTIIGTRISHVNEGKEKKLIADILWDQMKAPIIQGSNEGAELDKIYNYAKENGGASIILSSDINFENTVIEDIRGRIKGYFDKKAKDEEEKKEINKVIDSIKISNYSGKDKSSGGIRIAGAEGDFLYYYYSGEGNMFGKSNNFRLNMINSFFGVILSRSRLYTSLIVNDDGKTISSGKDNLDSKYSDKPYNILTDSSIEKSANSFKASVANIIGGEVVYTSNENTEDDIEKEMTRLKQATDLASKLTSVIKLIQQGTERKDIFTDGNFNNIYDSIIFSKNIDGSEKSKMIDNILSFLEGKDVDGFSSYMDDIKNLENSNVYISTLGILYRIKNSIDAEDINILFNDKQKDLLNEYFNDINIDILRNIEDNFKDNKSLDENHLIHLSYIANLESMDTEDLKKKVYTTARAIRLKEIKLKSENNKLSDEEYNAKKADIEKRKQEELKAVKGTPVTKKDIEEVTKRYTYYNDLLNRLRKITNKEDFNEAYHALGHKIIDDSKKLDEIIKPKTEKEKKKREELHNEYLELLDFIKKINDKFSYAIKNKFNDVEELSISEMIKNNENEISKFPTKKKRNNTEIKRIHAKYDAELEKLKQEKNESEESNTKKDAELEKLKNQYNSYVIILKARELLKGNSSSFIKEKQEIKSVFRMVKENTENEFKDSTDKSEEKKTEIYMDFLQKAGYGHIYIDPEEKKTIEDHENSLRESKLFQETKLKLVHSDDRLNMIRRILSNETDGELKLFISNEGKEIKGYILYAKDDGYAILNIIPIDKYNIDELNELNIKNGKHKLKDIDTAEYKELIMMLSPGGVKKDKEVENSLKDFIEIIGKDKNVNIYKNIVYVDKTSNNKFVKSGFYLVYSLDRINSINSILGEQQEGDVPSIVKGSSFDTPSKLGFIALNLNRKKLIDIKNDVLRKGSEDKHDIDSMMEYRSRRAFVAHLHMINEAIVDILKEKGKDVEDIASNIKVLDAVYDEIKKFENKNTDIKDKIKENIKKSIESIGNDDILVTLHHYITKMFNRSNAIWNENARGETLYSYLSSRGILQFMDNGDILNNINKNGLNIDAFKNGNEYFNFSLFRFISNLTGEDNISNKEGYIDNILKVIDNTLSENSFFNDNSGTGIKVHLGKFTKGTYVKEVGAIDDADLVDKFKVINISGIKAPSLIIKKEVLKDIANKDDGNGLEDIEPEDVDTEKDEQKESNIPEDELTEEQKVDINKAVKDIRIKYSNEDEKNNAKPEGVINDFLDIAYKFNEGLGEEKKIKLRNKIDEKLINVDEKDKDMYREGYYGVISEMLLSGDFSEAAKNLGSDIKLAEYIKGLFKNCI